MTIATNVYVVRAHRNDTVVHEVTVKNTDETAKDVSAATAIRYTVKDKYDGTQKFQKTLSAGITVTTNVITVTIPNSDMNLTPGEYVYDCEVTLSGQVQTVQSGPFIVDYDVS